MDKTTEKDLITRRIKLNEEARAYHDTNKAAWNKDHQAKFDTLMGEVDKIRTDLDAEAQRRVDLASVEERLAAEDRELAQSRGRKTVTVVSEGLATPSEDERDLAFRGWCLGRRATQDMRAAAQKCGVDIDNPEMNVGSRVRRTASGEMVRSFIPVLANRDGDILETRSAAEARALSIGTTTAGGNAVPNEMMRDFYEVQKWYARFAESAYQVDTETGATLPWPTVSDTANTGRILAEATTATTTTDPTFGVVNLGAFKFSSDGVLVSWELLQDSFINISGYLGTALGRRIGRIKNTKFTVGAGTTEPKGVIPAATIGVTATATNAFIFDDVISLIHSLDLAYRNLPDTQFMVHDTVAAALRKFKDGQGRYLWEMSTQVGQPDRLFGYPVLINNDMASAFTTGQKLLAFGNWKIAYIVRNAGAVRFVRADELYVKEHQVYFEASHRADGNLVDTTAVKVLALG